MMKSGIKIRTYVISGNCHFINISDFFLPMKATVNGVHSSVHFLTFSNLGKYVSGSLFYSLVSLHSMLIHSLWFFVSYFGLFVETSNSFR